MSTTPQAAAEYVQSRIPAEGLFAGLEWRIAPKPFVIERGLAAELEKLGRVLLQFNRSLNLLYRRSVEGKMPAWVAGWLDQGKPREIIEWQRSTQFKNELPRVIRPDILLTEDGFKITELDSVPGGIGLTGWLNQTYETLRAEGHEFAPVMGGARGPVEGFASIFPKTGAVHLVVSKESETYAPEMGWLAKELGPDRFQVRDGQYRDFPTGDNVYRFFELFDVPNVPNARLIFEKALAGELFVTAPPKAFLEEKMLFALLWNGNLREFWRRELGDGFFRTMLKLAPYSWIVDPSPLPPHAAIPELNLTGWAELKTLSQKDRDLILKVSGFSESAWGARGVYLGSDLPVSEWSEAVDRAVRDFEKSPFVLQRYHKPKTVEIDWVDLPSGTVLRMEGRARLCPYYFVEGAGDQAKAKLGGVLATICPADKKIIHGMRDAVLAPVSAV